jgi:hypothetical protein
MRKARQFRAAQLAARLERFVVDHRLTDSAYWMPEYLCGSAGLEHGPFALWIIEAARPRTLVELGTHNGFSFMAFCQAIQRLGLDTRAFAVDTWRGDEHAGFYGEDAYNNLAYYREQRYAPFSTLIRSTFDDALPGFADRSIDLLHVDGRHYYDDVRHDYISWIPKLSDRAVVLFHDTMERDNDFGVYRLWEEVAAGRPHFHFEHGHGLGVLGVGSDQSSEMSALFALSGDPSAAQSFRERCAQLGREVIRRVDAMALSGSGRWTPACERIVREYLTAGIDEVAAYGAGEVGRAFVAEALRAGLDIPFVIDRNPALWETTLGTVPVVSLDDAMQRGMRRLFVASFSFASDIRSRVEEAYVGRNDVPEILIATP